MLIWSTHSLLENRAPALQCSTILLVLCLSLQMAIRLLYQTSCFKAVGAMGKPVNSTCIGPSLHFIYGEASSLVGRNAVWNTMMVDPSHNGTIVINLPLGGWLITSGNGAVLGAQCWSLLLADWALSRGHSQTGVGEWKSILLSPCITSVPATWPHGS